MVGMESGMGGMKSRTAGRGVATGGRAVSLRRGTKEFSQHLIGEETVRRFLERINNQVSVIETHRAKVSSLARFPDRGRGDAVDRLAGNIRHNRAELGRELKKVYNGGYLEETIGHVDGRGFAEIIRAADGAGCMNLLLDVIDNTNCYSKAISSAYQGGCLGELVVSDEHLRRAIKGVVEDGSPNLLNKIAWALGFERMVKAAREEGPVVMGAMASLSMLYNYKGE